MTDESKKGINPVSPLGEGEPEPTPAERTTRYTGHRYPRTGPHTVQFPIVHPNAGRPENTKLVRFPNPANPKGKPPGGAA